MLSVVTIVGDTIIITNQMKQNRTTSDELTANIMADRMGVSLPFLSGIFEKHNVIIKYGST